MFTEAQRRALTGLLLLWAAVLGYQIVKQVLFPPPPFNFSHSDSLFQHYRDSLLAGSATSPRSALEDSTARTTPFQPKRHWSKESAADVPIDVNTADAATLTRLPRIGPAIARRIVAYRKTHGPFKTVDELLNVRGIGPKTLERIRPRIRLQSKPLSQ